MLKMMRHSAGVIGAVLLLAGVVLYFQESSNLFWAGMAVRVGALLAVIWLAWDQLMELRQKLPAIAFVVVGLLLVVLAARPNQGRFLIGLVVLAVAVSLGLKWASGFGRRPGG
jgi:hypothetical protein